MNSFEVNQALKKIQILIDRLEWTKKERDRLVKLANSLLFTGHQDTAYISCCGVKYDLSKLNRGYSSNLKSKVFSPAITLIRKGLILESERMGDVINSIEDELDNLKPFLDVKL